MIYMDNAATSYPKPMCVVQSIKSTLLEPLGNSGRGSHDIAVHTSNLIYEARKSISSFFGITNPMRLIFTKNATEALNVAIFGILSKGDHVITTSMEHNSVLRPLKHLEESGIIELSIVNADCMGTVLAKDIQSSIRSNTKLIIVTYSSNVNGTLTPVEEISLIAKNNGCLFMLDASQGAGSSLIDVNSLGVSLMAFPGHKGLMGPQGTGGLYVKEGIFIRPLIFGGTGSNSNSLTQPDFLPDSIESGTLNTPGILALKAGIDFINLVGINNIRIHKQKLLKRFVAGIAKIKDLELYSYKEINKNSGIVSIALKDVDSNDLSQVLDSSYNIKTRSGFHCAPLAHKSLKTTDRGLVRFSFGYFNTESEIDFCINSLSEISKITV